MGALTLSASSTIDLGNGASVLTFGASGSSFASGQTLTISNWSGTAGGGGADRLIFSQDMSSYLSRISFGGLQEATQVDLGGGQFEVTAVPEPGTWAGAACLLCAIAFRERRRLSAALAGLRSRAAV